MNSNSSSTRGQPLCLRPTEDLSGDPPSQGPRSDAQIFAVFYTPISRAARCLRILFFVLHPHLARPAPFFLELWRMVRWFLRLSAGEGCPRGIGGYGWHVREYSSPVFRLRHPHPSFRGTLFPSPPPFPLPLRRPPPPPSERRGVCANAPPYLRSRKPCSEVPFSRRSPLTHRPRLRRYSNVKRGITGQQNVLTAKTGTLLSKHAANRNAGGPRPGPA